MLRSIALSLTALVFSGGLALSNEMDSFKADALASLEDVQAAVSAPAPVVSPAPLAAPAPRKPRAVKKVVRPAPQPPVRAAAVPPPAPQRVAYKPVHFWLSVGTGF